MFEALEPPLEPERVMEDVPELGLARGVGQGDFHHLDTLGHILQTIREIEGELEDGRLSASAPEERRDGLRLVGLLHDIAKPVTRGELEGRVLFVAHDTLGARQAWLICRRLGVSSELTDMAATLTALHLKIGFMSNPRSDYPPERLVAAVGPFAAELAVLSWADRLAARGARLKPEHIERHRVLCEEFLSHSRARPLPSLPDYETLAGELNSKNASEAGYAAFHLRLLAARGVPEDEARAQVFGMLSGRCPEGEG